MTSETFINASETSAELQYVGTIEGDKNTIVIKSGPIFDLAEQSYFGILLYPLCIILAYIFLGLIGNSFVFYIFCMKWRRNKTSVFIITLAALDIFNCSVNMPIEVAVISRPLSFDFEIFCKIARCFSYITTASYSFVLVAVAFDRYLMVCRPLKRMTLDKRYATRTCIGAVLLGVLTQWPSLLIYGTFEFQIPINSANTGITNGSVMVVLGKTCLVTNYYYYIEPTLTYAFQGFLFVGHVVIFGSLTVMYIIIGRRLFISSHTDLVTTGKRPEMFKQSLMSAITGSALCSSNRADSASVENIHYSRHARMSAPTDITALHNRDLSTSEATLPHSQNSSGTVNPSPRDRISYEMAQNGNSKSKSMHNIQNSCTYSAVKQKANLNINSKHLDCKDGCQKCTHHTHDSTDVINDKSKRHQCNSNSNRNRISAVSAESSSERPLLSRSVSMDGSVKFATVVEKPRALDLKEQCLRRNTLIMRMVTFTFMLSYLPFLVLVTLRYSNPDIPATLTRTRQIVYHVFLRSYFFNSVIRPFIYAIMNKEYRNCVFEILHVRKCMK